jgi:hypothetical protein
MVSDLNFLAIGVASVVYFGLGSVWFGPLFSKQWLKLVGLSLTEEDKKNALFMFAKTFLLDFLITFSTALILVLTKSETTSDALKVSAIIGLGFVIAPFLGNYMYAKRSMKLFFIEGFYHVICIAIVSIILTIWR